MIVDGQTDIFVACETWHHGAEDVAIRRATPPGYSCLESARETNNPETTNHGGIAVIFKSCYSSKCIPLPPKPSKFECICLSIGTIHGPLTVLVVYRPGSEGITSEFFDEFSTLLETLSVFNSQLLIVGDFNVHIDNVDDAHGKRLLTLYLTLRFRPTTICPRTNP